jgi:YhcN/YlaJ family sporulation lipoprotein
VKLILMIAALLVFAAGCNQSSQKGTSSSPNSTQNGVKVQQIAPPQQRIQDPQAVADHLEKLATSVPHVQSAHCVVFGKTAVVGINVDPKMERSKVGTVKYSVAEALRKDPNGANAIVTADMDLSQRLRDIRENISSGRAVSGFAEQMADIIGRIMPQMPRDIPSTPSNPVPQDANQVGKPNL